MVSQEPGGHAAHGAVGTFTTHLSDGFGNLCGYAAMHDPTGGTVDHFLSFRHHRDLAYEWGNYRFAG